MKTAALIPARTGSKGIPNKNFNVLVGKPLVNWTVEAATKSGIFDKIILSSDGGFTDKLYPLNLEIDNNRPEKFATDEADLDSLLLYYAEKNPEIEMWCLLQPTSPLRTANDIKRMYNFAKREKYDSAVSVTQNPMMFWVKDATSNGHAATYHIHKRQNRQQRKSFFMENGAIYFTKTYTLLTMQCRLGGTIYLFNMPKERSFEIDEPIDWQICEMLMEGRRGRIKRAA